MGFPDLLRSSPSRISDGSFFWRVGDDLGYICADVSPVGLIHAGCCPTAQWCKSSSRRRIANG